MDQCAHDAIRCVVCRNDKVSIAAINLRKSWIQLTKSKTDSSALVYAL